MYIKPLLLFMYIKSYYCLLQVCERVFVFKTQWDLHIKGSKHMRVLKKKQREAQKAQESQSMEAQAKPEVSLTSS